MRLSRPWIYQGKGKNHDYFEGWYYKNVQKDGENVLSFIPGVSLGKDPHAFIQVIDGKSGRTWNNRYPLDSFRYQDDPFQVQIGDSSFSRDSLMVALAEPDIKGELWFQNRKDFPRRFLAPGIMGPFTYIPFMECYHGVVSMDHGLSGRIHMEGQTRDFSGGRGYIEKDWGKSFPSSWIWVQGNQFAEPGISLMFSLAKIPWLGSEFNGFLCFLLYGERLELFATYNGAKIQDHKFDGKTLEVSIKRGSKLLRIKVQQRNAGDLIAPVAGVMERVIKESVDSRVEFVLEDKGNLLFQGQSEHCGAEFSGDVPGLF
jgi:tocopherol cyclase